MKPLATILFIFLFAFPYKALCIDENPDKKTTQILTDLKKEKNESKIVDLYEELLYERSLPYDSVFLKYSNDFLQFAISKENNSAIANANHILGHYYLMIGEIQTSIETLEKAIEIEKTHNDSGNLVLKLNSLSYSYERIGNYEKAKEFALEALENAEKKDDKKNQPKIHKRLGEIYGYLLNDREKGLEYINKAINVYQESENKPNLAQSLMVKANILEVSDKIMAFKILKEAEKIALELNDISVLVYIRIGLIYKLHQQGRISEAIELVNKNLESAKQIKDQMIIISSYNSLGDLHSNLKQYDKASEYYNDAMAKSLESNMPQYYVTSAYGLGKVNNSQKKPEIALQYLEDAYQTADSINDAYLANQVLPLLGGCHLDLGNLQKGKEYSSLLLKNTEGRNDDLATEAKVNLGRYHLLTNDLKNASILLDGAKNNVKENKNFFLQLSLYKLLSQLEEKKKNYKKAYEYRNKQIVLQDSVNLKENQAKITSDRMSIEFENEKNILELENNKEKKILQERQYWTMIIGSLCLLGLLLLSIFYYYLRRKNKKISNQKIQLENLNNVKDQLFQIIGHDLKKPILSFRNISKNIKYLISKGDNKRLLQIGEEIEMEGKNLYNLTDNLLHWALTQKNLISLKPESLSLNSILEENIDLFQSTARRKDITITNNLNDDIFVFADHNTLSIVLRNIIDNAVKYSPFDSEIIIESHSDSPSKVSLSVADQGKGMLPSEIDSLLNGQFVISQQGTNNEKGSGLGLKIIKSMIEKNNGKMEIISSQEKGTTFIIDIPKAS